MKNIIFCFLSLIFIIGCNNIKNETISSNIDTVAIQTRWYESIETQKRYKVIFAKNGKESVTFLRMMSNGFRHTADSLNHLADKTKSKSLKQSYLLQSLDLSKGALTFLQTPYDDKDSLDLFVMLANQDGIKLVKYKDLTTDYKKIDSK